MRIAADIGGTFTDLVYWDDARAELGITKVATTPANFGDGVIHAFQQAARPAAAVDFFVHGTTIVINAITERKGVVTGLLTTHGFRDVLEIGRANRPDIYNMVYQKPPPFVPRYLRREVRGRMNFRGEVLTPLACEDVVTAARLLLDEGAEAIAVCFLHSYINPAHELECGEILRELAPGIPITLSHQITQEWREYERSNTAVLNAYVQPIVQEYLNSLGDDLVDKGVARRTLHVMQSNGGSATFAAGAHLPINLAESGPVAGVIGAARIGQLLGEPNVIALDVGGTTAKTSLVQDGTPRITTEYKIEHDRRSAGYPILVPTVDIVEIGAGGGSIAWVDSAGALRVGPQSAGADPGPACYDQGGREPTVTDANLIAGRINPDYFLGGEIALNVERASVAMQRIADAFSLSIEQAAMGVIRIADANMMNALKLVSVQRGYDPRDFVLVPFGGGGAMHGAALMRELQTRKVIVPTMPGVFSAWGMLMTDLRRDAIRTRVTRADRVSPEQLDEIYSEMSAQAERELRAQGAADGEIRVERYADMRYWGQEHTVKVSLASARVDDAALRALIAAFHDLHEQTYTFRLDTPTELVNYHVTAFGRVPTPDIPTIQGDGLTLAGARKGQRLVCFDEAQFQEAEIYERERLPLGEAIPGPAVIEEHSATIVVFPQQTFMRDGYGFIHIESEES